MVTHFEVGRYYALRPDYPTLKTPGLVTFEGRKTYFGVDKFVLFDHKPRQCSVLVDSFEGYTDVEFDGVKNGLWSYYPEDFIEDPYCYPIVSTPTVVNLPTITDVKTMELKDIKKKNLNEAKKQFDEEKTNAEVAYAKAELTRATNEIDRLDREIKKLEDAKKPYLEVLAKFQ